MEKKYKVSDYEFKNGTVTIHDPSSNEERQPILEQACIKFVQQQIKKGTGCNLSQTKK